MGEMPTLYQVKRAVLTPRTVYRRRKHPYLPPGVRHLLDQNYYRTPFVEFLVASVLTPELRTDFPMDHSSVVVDVGAHVAEWSQGIWDRYEPNIYAFEPAPPAVAKLLEGPGTNERFHVLPYGLGASDTTAEMHLSDAGSTIYGGQGETAEIQIRDVVAVFDELGITHVDVLKVNIEGGEYDLLDRLAETGWLERIDHVLVQFHEWHPKAYGRRWKNRRDLAKTHKEMWCWSWVWELWSRPTS